MAPLSSSLPKCGHPHIIQSCADCKAFIADWDKKLEKSGFEDIEQRDGNLKVWSGSRAEARFRDNYWQAKEEYYRLAGQFLHEHPFKDKKEKHIWELHSEGVAIKDIVKALRKRHFRASRDKVAMVIQQLVAEMKSRYVER